MTMGNSWIVHSFITALLVLECCLASDNCTDTMQNWERCDQDQLSFPNICYNSNEGQVIEISEDNSSVFIDCDNKELNNEVINCSGFHANMKMKLRMKDCNFTGYNTKEIFQEDMVKTVELIYSGNDLSVDVLFDDMHNLESVSVYGSRTGGPFQLKFGSQLPSILHLDINGHDFSTFPQEPFQNLSSLRTLKLSHGTLQILQEGFFKGLNSLSMLDLSYNRLKNLDLSVFEELSSLYELILTGNHISQVKAGPLTNISLEILYLGNNRLKSLPTDFFQHIPNLRILEISDNADLEVLPFGVLKGVIGLKTLIASNCSLNAIEESLTSVYLLNVSNNNLSRFQNTTLNSLISLRVLDVSQNPFTSLHRPYPFGSGKHLNAVKAKSCNLTEFPASIFSYNLSSIDLSYNRMKNIRLPVYTDYKTTVYLYGNDIVVITLYYETMLSNSPIYYLPNNTLRCDCNLRVFLGVLHSPLQRDCGLIAKADLLFCREPEKVRLVDVPWDKIMCSGEYCQSNCPCSKTVLNCSGMHLLTAPKSFRNGIKTIHLENNNILRLPEMYFEVWDSIEHLYLANNSLVSLENWRIPPHLKTISLNNNRLRGLPLSLLEAVEMKQDFHIYLAGNDWHCDCESLPFKRWIVRNKEKIRDVNETYCILRISLDGNFIFSRSLLLNTSDLHFCKDRVVSLTAVVIFMALMAAILLIGFFFFFFPLKVIRFKKL